MEEFLRFSGEMIGVRTDMERVGSKLKVVLVGVTSLEFWMLDIAVAVMLLVTSSLNDLEGELRGEDEFEGGLYNAWSVFPCD